MKNYRGKWASTDAHSWKAVNKKIGITRNIGAIHQGQQHTNANEGTLEGHHVP